MQEAFFSSFRQGVAGMSRDLGRGVLDLEKLYARKLRADFSHERKKTPKENLHKEFRRDPGRGVKEGAWAPKFFM